MTHNRKPDRSLFTKAEQSAKEKLKTPTVKEKHCKQDWYITALRVGRNQRLNIIDPDFLTPFGLISGHHYKLAQLNPLLPQQ